MLKFLIFMIAAIVFVYYAVVVFETSFGTESKSTSAQPVACTMDAKQCPDGSWVGRTGPDCQFVCPGE